MALKDKIYWESMAWKAASQLPLHCSMAEHSLEKQKATKASIKKAIKKAEPHRCFLTIEKENVAAAYNYNLATSSGPLCCKCKSSAQLKENCFGPSAVLTSADSIVTGARASVDSLVGRCTSAGWLVGARRSVDSAITAEFPEELLARIQAYVGRRVSEGISVKPSKDQKLGVDQCHGECKNVQRVKGSNVDAHEKISRRKDDRSENLKSMKGSSVYAHERSRSKGAKYKNVQGEEGTNVYAHAHQRVCRISMDEECKSGQWEKGSNVHAREWINRSIDSGLYVKIRSSDMPMSMQLHVVQLTKQVLDKQQEHLSLMDTARALKKGFDSQHGYVWHCVVGASYGSYVTHSVGSAIYFSMGNLAILLFKTNLSLPSSSP